eukprot:403355022
MGSDVSSLKISNQSKEHLKICLRDKVNNPSIFYMVPGESIDQQCTFMFSIEAYKKVGDSYSSQPSAGLTGYNLDGKINISFIYKNRINQSTSISFYERLLKRVHHGVPLKVILNETSHTLKVLITHQVPNSEPRYSQFYIGPKTLLLEYFGFQGAHNISLIDEENVVRVSKASYDMQRILPQPLTFFDYLNYMVLIRERQSDCNLEIIEDKGDLGYLRSLSKYCEKNNIQLQE